MFTCEHAGRGLPQAVVTTPSDRQLLQSHWGWDPGAWAATREASARLEATAIGGRWSRLWVDLNRHVSSPTLMRSDAGGISPSFNERLDLATRHQRIDAVHVPYHDAVDRLLRQYVVAGQRPWLVSIHSFTGRLGRQVRRYDMGVLYRDHAGPARAVARELRSSGLTVRYNQPYSGKLGMMYSAQRHGEHHDLVCIELELNQARFGAARQATALGQTIAKALQAAMER